MKKQFKHFTFLSLCIFLVISCNKAGSNGDASLVVFPLHHTNPIRSIAGYPDSIFVKFNAEEFPANITHNYDKVYIGVVGEDHVNLTTLNSGKYYLYATGWDTAIRMRVTGGMAVQIKYDDRKKTENVSLPVTE